MTRKPVPLFIIAVFCCGAVTSAFGLEIEGNFQLANLGFTQSRDEADARYSGSDYFWGGALSLRKDISNNIQFEAALARDLIMGNSLSALVQYKSDYVRAGMGPYLGLFNSPSINLKSGISTLLGLELPGVVFISLRTNSSLGGQSSDTRDYFAQSNTVLLGFYMGDFGIATLGLTYEQLNSSQKDIPLTDSLTVYSLDMKFFEKNVPYRLDFSFSYQALLRQYDDGGANPEHGLDSLIFGAGLDMLFTPEFALTLAVRASIYAFGTGVLSGMSDLGIAPFLFQASAGFRVTLPDDSAPAGQSQR